MNSAMDDLAQKFSSFETLMTQALDKLTGLEALKATSEEATERLLSQAERLATRLHRLEMVPPPPPPPPPPPRPATAPPQHLPRWTNPFDLNLAPAGATRPSASTGERPNGHHDDHTYRDVGGGILGPHPP